MTQQPIACMLSPDFRARLAQLLPGLRSLAREIERRDGRVALRFEPATGVLEQLARVIDAERRCCPFLHFRLTVEEDFGPVWLEVTGPPGVADMLCALIEE